MKVLPFITSEKELLELFENYLMNYDKLYFESKDIDTLFFNKIGELKHEIYLHSYFEDIQKQFSFNYTFEEQKYINCFFGNNQIYIFDIQYNSQIFVLELLRDFKSLLIKERYEIIDWILIYTDSRGIIKLKEL